MKFMKMFILIDEVDLMQMDIKALYSRIYFRNLFSIY